MTINPTLPRRSGPDHPHHPDHPTGPGHPGRAGRGGVPWSTVLPLGAALAYADGFWMTSLRGAVGAIERTQSPFATWWRESSLVLPVFVLAVLAALTLALRWFGPLPKARTVLGTALLITTAATIVGIAEIAASSAYDYHLQVNQLALMDSMHGICVASCLAQEQHATLAVHLHAVLYISRWLLLTNLALITWITAIRGGRLTLSTTPTPKPTNTPPKTGNRATDLRHLLIAALLASAAIHAAVTPEHLRHWSTAGTFFILLTTAELATAATLLARPHQRAALPAATTITTITLLIWLYSRTAGIPFGPHAGIPQHIGIPDTAASTLELAALLTAIALQHTRKPPRTPATAHLKALTITTLIAITTIGLAATSPTLSHDLANTTTNTTMNM
jgi:hypothetical protein